MIWGRKIFPKSNHHLCFGASSRPSKVGLTSLSNQCPQPLDHVAFSPTVLFPQPPFNVCNGMPATGLTKTSARPRNVHATQSKSGLTARD